MVDINTTAVVINPFTNFHFWTFVNDIKPLALYAFGIFLYGLFVFKFYKFLAKRDILTLKLKEHSSDFKGVMKKLMQFLYYALENLIVIPILIFFWFVVLAVILLFLGKSHTPSTILLTSMGIVGSVRIAAYYNEELAQELSKMVPLGMLAIFLVDISYFSIESSIAKAQELPGLWSHFLYYLLVVVMMEFMLRLVKFIIYKLSESKKKDN